MVTLAPGATIGILGGGQLGRMLALAAARLGLRTHVFCPDPDSPAFEVSSEHTVAAYEDEAALRGFADSVEVVTYEFENVPARTAEVLAERRAVRRDAAGGLPRAVAQIGRPSILKTRRLGYDGKGQTTIKDGSDLGAAFRSLGGTACILEGMVPFEREVSVVCARGQDGAFAAFDICENAHRGGILHRTVAPADVALETAAEAVAIARKIADALRYVGVLAVEFFVTREQGGERLAVNEIAPRVHNSGHWTEGGAVTSQFEQHVRAICGWPLGTPTRHGARVEMENLIGAEAEDWAALLARPGVSLHLYGKAEVRPGRKMGHWTRVVGETV